MSHTPPAMWAMEIDFVGTQRICRGDHQDPLPRGEQRRLFTVFGLEMTHLPFPLVTLKEALPQFFFNIVFKKIFTYLTAPGLSCGM